MKSLISILTISAFVLQSCVPLEYKVPETNEDYKYYEPEFKEDEIKEVVKLFEFCYASNNSATVTTALQYEEMKNKIDDKLLSSNKFYPLQPSTGNKIAHYTTAVPWYVVLSPFWLLFALDGENIYSNTPAESESKKIRDHIKYCDDKFLNPAILQIIEDNKKKEEEDQKVAKLQEEERNKRINSLKQLSNLSEVQDYLVSRYQQTSGSVGDFTEIEREFKYCTFNYEYMSAKYDCSAYIDIYSKYGKLSNKEQVIITKAKNGLSSIKNEITNIEKNKAKMYDYEDKLKEKQEQLLRAKTFIDGKEVELKYLHHIGKINDLYAKCNMGSDDLDIALCMNGSQSFKAKVLEAKNVFCSNNKNTVKRYFQQNREMAMGFTFGAAFVSAFGVSEDVLIKDKCDQLTEYSKLII